MSHETGTPDDVYDLIETIGIGMLVTSRQGATCCAPARWPRR